MGVVDGSKSMVPGEDKVPGARSGELQVPMAPCHRDGTSKFSLFEFALGSVFGLDAKRRRGKRGRDRGWWVATYKSKLGQLENCARRSCKSEAHFRPLSATLHTNSSALFHSPYRR